ncbi:unannotated protein [freshwater metagenome]|uniref:Unannotated protein n=1 Tax=freshwater metagenome TaxID=449393 RepID=A0A6J6L631_9ZZZZ
MRKRSGLRPRSTYQAMRVSIQYWCQSSSLPGTTKNSISICSNSRVRKIKFPGVISLRKDFPIWPIPKGGFLREVVITWSKLMKIPCAVSGRKYARPDSSSTGPRNVLSNPLNCLGVVNCPLFPQAGQLTSAKDAGFFLCFASKASSR